MTNNLDTAPAEAEGENPEMTRPQPEVRDSYFARRAERHFQLMSRRERLWRHPTTQNLLVWAVLLGLVTLIFLAGVLCGLYWG